MQEIDFLMSVRGKNTVRITLPMVKQEHILLASSTLAELSDELLDISKKISIMAKDLQKSISRHYRVTRDQDAC